ncbi:ComEA family DNA-binding protein [Vibrio sp. FJH11]
MKWVLALFLCVFAPLGLAAELETSKYEGIEITVNVNSASAKEIATMLKGIGEKKAQDIVDYRTEHGPFKTVNDLTNVKGIGAATLQKNENRIVL